MEQAVSQRILRRVSTRDYAGVLEDVWEGYGIDKSSVSRQGKAASSGQLQQMMERSLRDLDLCVLFLDGKEFHDFTLTINRLNLSPQLRRLLASTNIIESCLSRVGDGCRNVKRWRDANMARRWVGAVLLEAKERFHRVQGYQEMPLLIQALGVVASI